MALHQSLEEKELLQLVASGNEDAFRKLVHEYSGLTFKFIFQHLEDKPQAEEIVQDIFVKIWLTRETLVHLQSFRAFLLVVARNHAFNAIKKMVREKSRKWEWEQAVQPVNEKESQQQELLFSLMEEAVEQLPPQQQRAWVLCRKSGLKYEQAANEMRVSRDAVKKYLQYANTSIKKYILTRVPIGLL